jgi:hypothetical protein
MNNSRVPHIIRLTQTIAPASEAVEYEEIVFKGGFFTKANEFMGFPSVETDRAWEELYNCKCTHPFHCSLFFE